LAVEEHTSLASKDSCRVMVSQKFTLLEQGVQLSQPQLQAESGSEEQSQPAGVLADAAMGSLQVRPVSSAGVADGLLGKSLFA
jgi:hypothetical protein